METISSKFLKQQGLISDFLEVAALFVKFSSEQGIPPSFQRNEQIKLYCILFKETCIKACCTVVSERATAYWRIPFQNNAIFPARNTILLQMAIPCIALYYRHITLFQRDCCIYERVPFCTTTYCKSHHTQPYSFTRTAVCLEGYFLKWMLLLKGILCVTVCVYI